MNKRTFRTILILGWASFVAASAAQLVTRPYLPAQLQEFLASEHRERLAEGFSPALGVAVIVLVFSLTTQVGMFLLKPWARPCYVAALLLNYLFLFFFGPPMVTTATGYALASLNAALTGFLLALIYFSPFKKLFERGEGLA